MVAAIAVGIGILAVIGFKLGTKNSFSFTDASIIFLTLITAIIHLFEGLNDMLLLFNGLGYLGFLGFLSSPGQAFATIRPVMIWGLLAYTLITLAAFFVIHPWGMAGDHIEWLGLGTKVVEFCLGLVLALSILQIKKGIATKGF